MIKWYLVVGTASIALATLFSTVLAIQEPSRMEDFTVAFQARQIEGGAALFESNCRSCHGPQGKGIEGVAPSINAADLYDGSRLEAVGYAGSVEDYVRSAIAAGRPLPSEGTNYPQRMPTWSQDYGGPLRGDQVEALVQYVMNWEETALAEGEVAEPTPPPGELAGTDITVALPEGDPANGESLSESLGCSGCHILAAVGPAWLPEGAVPGIGERAEERYQQADYTGAAENAEQYLVEAIVQTNVHIVEGFQPNIMPGNYGERISVQDLADMVAYLLSLR